MRRASILVELLIVVSIVVMIVALLSHAVGVADTKAHEKATAAEAAPQPAPELVLGEPSNRGYMTPGIRELTDTVSGQHYIIVQTSNGVAITPRLPTKERQPIEIPALWDKATGQ